jgi:hypothetical protein
MKIRDDLEGVVYVQTEEGVVVLKGGDTIPSGVELGEHLTKKDDAKKSESAEEDADAGSKPRRGRPARSGSNS